MITELTDQTFIVFALGLLVGAVLVGAMWKRSTRTADPVDPYADWYCQDCGATWQDGLAYCPGCGKRDVNGNTPRAKPDDEDDE